MARITTDPNYTTPTFSRATAGTDLFVSSDVQGLAAAVSTHDHTTGKGVPVGALASSVALQSGGTTFSGGPLILAASTELRSASGSNVTIRGGTTDAETALSVLPNGTSRTSSIYLNNVSSGSNASFLHLQMFSDHGTLGTNHVGSGADLPLYIGAGGHNNLQLAINGAVATEQSLQVNSSRTANQGSIQLIGTDGSQDVIIFAGGGPSLFIRQAGTTYFQNAAGTLPGPLSCGAFNSGAIVSSGDIAFGTATGGQLTFGSDAGCYLLRAAGALFHRAPAGGGHYMQTVAGGFAPVGMGSLTVTGTIGVSGRITASGDLVINAARTGNGAWISFQTQAGSTADCNMFAENGQVYLWFGTMAGSFNIQQGGGGSWRAVAASAFTVSSSASLKSDLVPLDPATALGQVLDERVTPTAYTYVSGTRSLGFMAEDMVNVVPEVVSLDAEGKPMGIEYGTLTTVLWSAMRELASRVTALEGAAVPA